MTCPDPGSFRRSSTEPIIVTDSIVSISSAEKAGTKKGLKATP